MVNPDALRAHYKGKTVLVTGHTGFKGSWLALWLQELGAKVIGYSLPPPTQPSNFVASAIEKTLTHVLADVRDFPQLQHTIEEYEPEMIFHLAAQPIVLHGYDQPKETFDVNAGGTVNVLEAARPCACVKGIVVITTDKCYDNQEWTWGYRENDRLGGHDPYSSSKSMAELAAAAYRASYNGKAIATARAGNVIGGGDFSEHRLIPDCMRALLAGRAIPLRNPQSVRPWLHVLDPLWGYLQLGARLLQEGNTYAEAWNFGPLEHQAITTQQMVDKAIDLWGSGSWEQAPSPEAKHEMGLLRLNWDKAANQLGWKPLYSWEEAIDETISWFKAYAKQPEAMRPVCIEHIQNYMAKR